MVIPMNLPPLKEEQCTAEHFYTGIEALRGNIGFARYEQNFAHTYKF